MSTKERRNSGKFSKPDVPELKIPSNSKHKSKDKDKDSRESPKTPTTPSTPSTHKTLLNVLSSDLSLLFFQHLKETYSAESLKFILELDEYKGMTDPQESLRCAKLLYDTYVAKNSVAELPLDDPLRFSVERNILKGHIDSHLFDGVEQAVLTIMETDLLPQFYASKHYQIYKANSDIKPTFFSKKKKIKDLCKIEKTKSFEQLQKFLAKDDHLIAKDLSTHRLQSIEIPTPMYISSSEGDIDFNNSPSFVLPSSSIGLAQGMDIFAGDFTASGAQGFLSFTKEEDINKLVVHQSAPKSITNKKKSKKPTISPPPEKEHISHRSRSNSISPEDMVDNLSTSPSAPAMSSVLFGHPDKKSKKRGTLKTQPSRTFDKMENIKEFLKIILSDRFEILHIICDEELLKGGDAFFKCFTDVLCQKGKFIDFIEQRLLQELTAITSHPGGTAVIFREETVFTKVISTYFMTKGKPFLKRILNPMVNLANSSGPLEIDPDKAQPTDDIENNIIKLNKIANDLFASLCFHIDALPHEMRYVCYKVKRIVEIHNPAIVPTVMSNLIFLRFFCPAIVTADREVSSEALQPRVKRTLILLAKLLQNLVAGVEFDGTKESYMTPLNTFIKEHQQTTTSLIKSMSTLTPSEESIDLAPENLFPMKMLDTSLNVIRDSLVSNMDAVWSKALQKPETLTLFKFLAVRGLEVLEFDTA